MRNEDIDSNFKLESNIKEEGLVWYNVRNAPFEIYGLHEPLDDSVPFHRMDTAVASKASVGVETYNFRTAGGRARFETNSPYIAIKCEMTSTLAQTYIRNMPFSGSHGFDLWSQRSDGSWEFFCAFAPTCPFDSLWYDGIYKKCGDELRQYTLNFPLYGTCKNLYIGIKEGSVLRGGVPYCNEKPIVFYGSSITQGGCATRPGSCYENYISSKYNVNYTNLGFGGSAKGEKVIADYLASLDMSIFVCDYDHNAPTLEHLRATLPNIYETVRRAHPNIPYVFMSSPDLELGTERRDFIKSVYQNAMDNGDLNVYFVDGAEMFKGEFSKCCTADGTHPTDLGFFRMFEALDKVISALI